MINTAHTSTVILASCLLAVSCSLPFGGREITVASYNVHNLFDDVDDGTEYDDYDPGSGRWSSDQFRQKLWGIAEAVDLITPGGPDILALQEVEGDKALDTLVDEYLRTSGYTARVLAADSGGAVRVALLSRYPVTSVRNHRIEEAGIGGHRFILEVWLDIDGVTLHVFNNHWKSKSGGAPETESARIASSRLVRHRIDHILKLNPAAEIIILGDLNESVDEYERIQQAYVTALLSAGAAAELGDHGGLIFSLEKDMCAVDGSTLYSPWGNANAPGSYVFRGEWQTLDHILVSPGLLDESDLSFSEYTVVDDPRLTDNDGFPDVHNFSDHLPVLARLTLTRSAATPPVVAAIDRDG